MTTPPFDHRQYAKRLRAAFICWTIGIIITVYGLTRFCVTYSIVTEDVRLFNDSNVRLSPGGNRLYKMIAHTGGWDMWASAGIGCCAVGVALLFTAYYLRSSCGTSGKT